MSELSYHPGVDSYLSESLGFHDSIIIRVPMHPENLEKEKNKFPAWNSPEKKSNETT